MYATDPLGVVLFARIEPKKKPGEGSAAGCRSVEWLRGRRCCEACDGDHNNTQEKT